MRSDNSPLRWKGEEHPPLEVLREYQEHALPAPATQEVEEHLADCDLCTDLVQGMTLSDRTATRKAVGDLNAQLRHLGNRKRQRRLPLIPLLDWRAAATIVVLLCSVGLVVYFIYGQVQQEKLAAARKAELAAQAELAQFTSPVPDTLLITVPGLRVPAAPATTTTAPALAYQQAATADAKPAEGMVAGAAVPQEASSRVLNSGNRSAEKDALAGADAVAPAGPVAMPAVASAKQLAKHEAPPLDSAEQPIPNALQGRLAGVAVQDKTEIKITGNQRQGAQTAAKATAPAVVRSATESVGNTAVVAAQQLKGQVVSEQGEGLPGVSVFVKGTSTGTSTDSNGNFSLPASVAGATLSFNYVGYQQEEVKVNANTSSVKVELSPSHLALQEVVVTGYNGTAPASAAAAPLAGTKAYEAYIKQNRRYPAAAPSEKVSGRVVVGFTVTAMGTVENLRILKNLHPALDAEAIRLVKEGPAWKPAIKNGKPVPQEVKVRIRFKAE